MIKASLHAPVFVSTLEKSDVVRPIDAGATTMTSVEGNTQLTIVTTKDELSHKDAKFICQGFEKEFRLGYKGKVSNVSVVRNSVCVK